MTRDKDIVYVSLELTPKQIEERRQSTMTQVETFPPSAWDEGYDAYENGDRWFNNPYDPIAEKEWHKEWHQGWMAAAEND